MKLKEGFELHKIAEQYVAVQADKSNQAPLCTVNLNGTGAFLWEALSKDRSLGELVLMLTARYDIDEEAAKDDIMSFVALLNESELLE